MNNNLRGGGGWGGSVVQQSGLIRPECVTCAAHTDRDYRLIGNLFGITSKPALTGTRGRFSYIHLLQAGGCQESRFMQADRGGSFRTSRRADGLRNAKICVELVELVTPESWWKGEWVV